MKALYMRSYAVKLYIELIRLYHNSPNHIRKYGCHVAIHLGLSGKQSCKPREKGGKYTSKHVELPGAHVSRMLLPSSRNHNLMQNFLFLMLSPMSGEHFKTCNKMEQSWAIRTFAVHKKVILGERSSSTALEELNSIILCGAKPAHCYFRFKLQLTKIPGHTAQSLQMYKSSKAMLQNKH